MRLLFGIKGMNNAGGGAERVLASVASGLAQRGHQVSLLTYDPPGGHTFYPLYSSIERVELGLGSTLEPASFLVTLRRISASRAAIKRRSPDAVIGFMHSIFIPLAISRLGLRIPLIASEHTIYQHYDNRRLEAALLYAVPLVAQAIVCVSEEVKSTYPNFLRERMAVVPNPVTMAVKAKADVCGRSGIRKRLLAVGKLDSAKDHCTLISAFGQVADCQPDWDLLIVGEGPLRSKLEKQVADLGLDHRITFPGTVEDIADQYQKAQLFVIPSRYESFSLATAEALAHGLPVIGFSDCAAIGQLIRPGENGVLVTPNGDRAAALAAALLPIMQDSEVRARLANDSHLPEVYRLQHVLDQWEGLLDSVVSRRGG